MKAKCSERNLLSPEVHITQCPEVPWGGIRAWGIAPLYRGQPLVHGLGYSPDSRTLAVVSVASNAVTLVATATNTVKGTVYVGRSPHEAFFTADGQELWVTVRGEDYISVIDTNHMKEIRRIELANGPGMTMFGTDGTRLQTGVLTEQQLMERSRRALEDRGRGNSEASDPQKLGGGANLLEKQSKQYKRSYDHERNQHTLSSFSFFGPPRPS